MLKRAPYRTYWNMEVALYRGDELVDKGRIKDIAERWKVLPASIYAYLMPSVLARTAKCKRQDRITRVVQL